MLSMKLGRLFDKYTCERREEMQNSLVIMSLALVSLVAILTIVMTTSIHFDSTLDILSSIGPKIS